MIYYRGWCREVCKFSSKLYITISALTQHGYRNGFEGLDESELRNIRKKGRRERGCVGMPSSHLPPVSPASNVMHERLNSY